MKEFLWVEKYRPQRINDVVLPTDLKKTFSEIVKSGEVPNMLFTGTAGLGKTTVAKAICNELNIDYLMVNCSEEGGIDTLRNKIRSFASSISLDGGVRLVILDEADYLNANSTQPALRSFIEEFSSNCRFILTCNFKNRIIEPLHSRCSVFDFNFKKTSLEKLQASFLRRLESILKSENVDYDIKVLVELIKKHSPDWRRVINECQRHSTSGELTTDVLVSVSDESLRDMMEMLRRGEFVNVRKWVSNNSDLDGTVTFRSIYDSAYEYMTPPSIPEAVLILSKYGYQSSFVADKEINLMACLTELMVRVKWK
jgi:DNA polymerase III delta prime subunit